MTVVLLGAGASAEAGVPMSAALAQALTVALNAGHGWRHSAELHALNAAIGAMIAHDTARGGSAYDGVDVERLFSAVEMLAERDSLEIAPFVASWNPALDGLPSMSSSPMRGQIFDSLKRALTPIRWGQLPPDGGDRFERYLDAKIQRSLGGYSGETFDALRRTMVDKLVECLHVRPASSDYLAPLLNARAGRSSVQVATLNYDLAVEQMAQRWGRTVSTGLGEWDGGFDWGWPDSDIRLLKLHGSLRWYVEPDPRLGRTEGPIAPAPRYIEAPTGEAHPQGSRLGVVFGQRGKVRSDGPFLAMLHEFDRWLREATELVIVGYSFRDAHINGVLRRVLSAKPDLPVTIVDPNIGEESDPGLLVIGRTQEFLGELLMSMSEKTQVVTESGATKTGRGLRDQHRTITKQAGDGLVERFGEAPAKFG